jgi:hypothetical protein
MRVDVLVATACKAFLRKPLGKIISSIRGEKQTRGYEQDRFISSATRRSAAVDDRSPLNLYDIAACLSI